MESWKDGMGTERSNERAESNLLAALRYRDLTQQPLGTTAVGHAGVPIVLEAEVRSSR